MEDSWRFGQNQGNICCPSCSISHFPFCPPLPPSYDPSLYKPYFDPRSISSYNDHHRNPINPITGFPIDPYNDQNSRSHHRDTHRQPSSSFDYGEFRESDRIGKRMRVGEMGPGPGPFSHIPPPLSSRLSAEDERILSLIRQHGAPQIENSLNGYNYGSSVGDWQERSSRSSVAYGQNGDSFYTLRDEPPRLQSHYGQNHDSLRNSVQRYGTTSVPPSGVLDYGNTSRLQFREEESLKPCNNSQYAPYEGNAVRQSFEVKHPPVEEFRTSMVEQFGAPHMNGRGTYLPISTGNNMGAVRPIQEPNSRTTGVYPPPPPLPPPVGLSVYPPLPPFPPPSLPMEPPGPPPAHLHTRARPPTVPVTSSDAASLLHSSALEGRPFPPKNPSPEKPKLIDASSIFKRPNRDFRPDHIVVILRGLPGSGKSYLAKMLRDIEVENGAKAPRIHSMDDYFMTEVEKVEESELSKSSGSGKGKKRVTKKVMEYCYEPEMEEAYRSSMLKAFKKTLEDGTFTFIIVDDRNLRVADFAQFWATAKMAGYEVYLLEAMYKDPVGCAARNIHGFSSDDIQKMAEVWEEPPSLYLRLDTQSLFHGDALNEQGIQEVDMDMDDVACGEDQTLLQNSIERLQPPGENRGYDDSVNEEEKSDAEGDDHEVKELRRSKWLHDADEENIERSEHDKKSSNALSGLIQAYTKGDKSVHWGDQVGKGGFSIGANIRAKVSSLVIGPGAGYNLKSNPLPEEENEDATDTSWQSKKRSVFEEHLRAERASERETFKGVIDRRRQRIGGLEMDDES